MTQRSIEELKNVSKTLKAIKVSVMFLIAFQICANVLYFTMPSEWTDIIYYNGLMFAISFSVTAWGVASWLGWESEKAVGDMKDSLLMKLGIHDDDIEKIQKFLPVMRKTMKMLEDVDTEKVMEKMEVMLKAYQSMEESKKKKWQFEVNK